MTDSYILSHVRPLHTKERSKRPRLDIATLVEPLTEPVTPRFNGAPGQEHWVIRQHPKTGERHLDRLWWGLIPYWTKEATPRHKPINATAERVAAAPMFRAAYAKRRCLVPVDNFFEWATVEGARGRGSPMSSPCAAVRRSRWRASGRAGGDRRPTRSCASFCGHHHAGQRDDRAIHDRMPVILPPQTYDRWLSTVEPDPRDLLVPHPSDSMTMWPVSPKVNKPDHDDPSILAPAEPPPELAPRLDL